MPGAAGGEAAADLDGASIIPAGDQRVLRMVVDVVPFRVVR